MKPICVYVCVCVREREMMWNFKENYEQIMIVHSNSKKLDKKAVI